MYMHRTQLATRFHTLSGYASENRPLDDDQIRRVAPSIFAAAPHGSRSDRYTYIPTSTVLDGLRKEGFEPFMACQAKTRNEDKREHTKHMLRLRHASRIAGAEANEIILVNSHDGSSSYQMLAGCNRLVCHNGLICGETVEDLRVRHNGDVVGQVIEGAYRILDEFEQVDAAKDRMKSIALAPAEQIAFARAALAVRYDEDQPAPITERQVLEAHRAEDQGNSLWETFNRTQENLVRGGLRARTANGRITRTRAVQGIDQNVKLNRALWVLGEEMAKLSKGN